MPGRTHMISVRLTDAERRKLSQICAVSGLPVSAAIREMIGGITIRQRPPQELHDLYVEITEPGGHILDPFAGSGTTVLAAVQEGYTATGIEVTDTYAELARERIRKELACAA